MTPLRRIHYLGAPMHFMQHLLDQGKPDTAWAIKAHILEVCKLGPKHPQLTPQGQTPNLFTTKAPAAPSDGGGHPGFWMELLVLEDKVIVVTLGVLAS